MKVTKRIKILRDILKYADISTVDKDIIESVIVGLEVDICIAASRLDAVSNAAGYAAGYDAGLLHGRILG